MSTTSLAPGPCQQHDYCGCQAAACCLDCPLPYCRSEAPVLRERLVKERREKAMELQAAGFGVLAISRVLSVNRATVYKDIEISRKEACHGR
jgi:hypothetical protein